jgi:hypothetical protein
MCNLYSITKGQKGHPRSGEGHVRYSASMGENSQVDINIEDGDGAAGPVQSMKMYMALCMLGDYKNIAYTRRDLAPAMAYRP